jgi:uncharacterized protein (TIGR02145 family)
MKKLICKIVKYLTDLLSEVATWCNHDPIVTIQYGALYNWYAATDARNIANTGWRVITMTDSQNLMSYIEPGYNNLSNTIGQKLKEEGTTYWDTTGGTNIYSLNIRGNGTRTNTFVALKAQGFIHTATEQAGDPNDNWHLRLQSSTNTMAIIADLKWHGRAIRLIKESTSLIDGQTGTYTGNDGKVYRTICIGTQEWVADNIAETKYRNGDAIPVVTDNATWAALVTGAMCYYNNDISNA